MRAIRPGRRIAARFGTSSPRTMCSAVIMAIGSTAASVCAAGAARLPSICRGGWNRAANASSPTQPRPRLTMVTPSWHTDRYLSRLATTSLARCEPGRRDETISWMRVARTLTMANSAATKKAFPATSRNARVRYSATCDSIIGGPRGSQLDVLRAAAPLRGDPGDDLVRVGDVARLAVDAVAGVDLQPPSAPLLRHHLVHRRRAEPLARVAVLRGTARLADRRIGHVQVDRLVLVVLRPRVEHVGQLVDHERVVVARRHDVVRWRRGSELGEQ